MDHQVASYPLASPSETDGLVVHCSDPRFQQAFARFIANELAMRSPAKIIVPGGIHDLVSLARPKAARQMWGQVEFMIKELGLKRVVIINHDDCKWYRRWNALVANSLGGDVVGHLLAATRELMSHRLGVEIETYLAKIVDGNVVFDKVNS